MPTTNTHFEQTLQSPANFVIPADPEGMNDERADWAGHAVNAFEANCSGFGVHAMDAFADITNMRIACEDDETILSDLLADLMHWADRAFFSFGDVLAAAMASYDANDEEMTQEAYGGSNEEILTDLLRNLKHLCNQKDLSFDVLVSRAEANYEEETRDDEEGSDGDQDADSDGNE